MASCEKRRLVGVFWDIENCAVPNGKAASRVVEKIRTAGFMAERREMDFLVVCDVHKVPSDVIDELNNVPVQVQHVSSAKKKNAADEKLRQAMRKFVDTFSSDDVDLALVLISGDIDFVSDLSDFKRRRAVYVVLLHNRLAGEYLLNAAHEAHDFHAMLEDVPRTQVQLPFQYTELEVTNLPSVAEMPRADIERRLEFLVKAFHGKVKYCNERDGTAVLKFENGDKASRALKTMKGEMVGNRKIQVDFNRRLNFVAALNRRSQSASPSPSPPATTRPTAAVTPVRPTGARPRQASLQRTIRNDPAAYSSTTDDDGEAAVAAATPLRPGGIAGPSSSSSSFGITYTPLRVQRNLTGSNATRSVHAVEGDDRDGNSNNGNSSASSDSSRRSPRRPRRKRKGSSQSRLTTMGQLERQMESAVLTSSAAEDDDIVTVSASVMTVIRNIVTPKNKKEATKALKAILAKRKISYNVFSIRQLLGDVGAADRLAHFECEIETEDLASAQRVVDCMDGFAFDAGRIQADFVNEDEGVRARVLSLLQSTTPAGEASAVLTAEGLRTKYLQRYGEGRKDDLSRLTVENLRRMPDLSLARRGDGQRTVDIRQEPSLRRKRGSVISLLHPVVFTSLENLRERLQMALTIYAHYGIPYIKIMEALNATTADRERTIVESNRPGGVPLEQLIEATGVAKLIKTPSGEVKYFRKPSAGQEVTEMANANDAFLKKLENEILVLLEATPKHRMKVNKIAREYEAKFGTDLESACRPFGGLEIVFSSVASCWSSNRICTIGMGHEAEVIPRHSYQRTVFLIALRKIISSQPEEVSEKSVYIGNEEEFRHHYEARIRRPFCLEQYGVCTVQDLVDSLFKTRQDIFERDGGHIALAPRLQQFIRNALDVLSNSEGFALSLEDFGNAYCAAHGPYSARSFTYPSIKELFSEFSHEFRMTTRDGAEHVSLSKSSVLRTLNQRLFDLLVRSADGMLPVNIIPKAYGREFKSDLTAVLQLNDLDLGPFCAQFSASHDGIASCRFDDVDIIYLSDSTFIGNFEKRVIALLHQKKSCATVEKFLTAYSRMYGPQCFLSLHHILQHMTSVVTVDGFGSGPFRLLPEAESVVELAKRLLADGQLDASRACVGNVGEMREMCRAISDLVEFDAKTSLFYLNSRGASYFFSLLSPTDVEATKPGAQLARESTPTGNEGKKGKRSRIAASFQCP